MIGSLYNAVLEWHRNTNDRQKLQHCYLLIVVASVLVAGLVSLIDARIGQDMLIIPLVGGAIFLVNAIVWSLLDSIFIARLTGRRKRQ